MHEILNEEIRSHVNYVAQQNTFKNYVHPKEWEEVEHTDISLNPVFIDIYDTHFKRITNSPNLVQQNLNWEPNLPEHTPYYKDFNSIRLIISQSKLIHHGEIVGYVIIGVSTKHNELALEYLLVALYIIFPISVIIVFFLARIIASKAIQPVFNVIEITQSISENNLSERIELPENKDELHNLSCTINSLLDRLEFQIVKAKQFSADASHELRTPLAVIKGTLEILIRRERSVTEYNEKINYTLKQVDRLYLLVEQFLLLSRLENNNLQLTKANLEIKDEVIESLTRFELLIEEKNISVDTSKLEIQEIINYKEFTDIIIDNVISNAIKYVHLNGKITISSFILNNNYHLEFKDNGIGIKATDLKFIQERYFRINEENTEISGYGLGLNIASKLAEISNIKIDIESNSSEGTRVLLQFEIK